MAVNTQQQMRLIDKVAGRFVERVDEMLEGELKNLSDVIDSTCRSQLAATAIVQEGMQNAEKVLKNAAQLEKNLEDMVGKLEGYMESLKHTQPADDSYLRIASNVEKIELVAGQQNSYLKSVSAMHGELNRSMLSMQEAQKAMLQRFSEVSGESTAGLMKAAGELRATGAMLENNRQRIGEQLRLDLSDTLDSFRDYMAEFTKRVDYLSAGIADALNQLPDAVGGATDHFLDQIDRISQALERAEASLSAAAARLYRQ